MASRTTSATCKQRRSRPHRLAFVALTPLAALALIASTAPTSDAADVGVIVDTANGGNARVRTAPSIDASVVDVLPDGTRLPDAECRVRITNSTVWTKLRGERYIRADLTGFDTRLPECDAVPGMSRTPDSIDRPTPVSPQPPAPVAMVEMRADLNCLLLAGGVNAQYVGCLMWENLGEEQREKALRIALGCVAGMSSTAVAGVAATLVSGGSAVVITVPDLAVGCVSGGLANAGLKVLGVNDTGA